MFLPNTNRECLLSAIIIPKFMDSIVNLKKIHIFSNYDNNLSTIFPLGGHSSLYRWHLFSVSIHKTRLELTGAGWSHGDGNGALRNAQHNEHHPDMTDQHHMSLVCPPAHPLHQYTCHATDNLRACAFHNNANVLQFAGICICLLITNTYIVSLWRGFYYCSVGDLGDDAVDTF